MHDEPTIALEADGRAVVFAPGEGGPVISADKDVALAKEGDPGALRRLYDEHRERVFRTAYRYSGSTQDAEDILQETFIKAFARIRTFDPRISPKFSSWLLTICVNTALDALRSRGRRKSSKHVSLADIRDDIPADGPSPEAAAARALAVDRIRETLRVLSRGQRAVFDLRFNELMDVKDIAGALRCSESNVKTQLARALSKLRKTLGPERGGS